MTQPSGINEGFSSPGAVAPAATDVVASVLRETHPGTATQTAVPRRFSTEMIIEPKTGWVGVNFREQWRHRELLYFLIWRDVKVRYKQTVLGIAWAVLVPIFSMLVFTVIFGRFAGFKNLLPSGLENAYAVFTYAGLLPWLFFSNAVSQGGLSLVNQQHLLTRIYFPRLFVPTATVGSALVDMMISLLVFAGLMAWYGLAPPLAVLLLPLVIAETVLASLGVAYLLSALTVTYRDFRFIIPFMVQAWQFLSPVVYPSTIVPERYRVWFAINPMAGIIDAFRWCTLGIPVSPAVVVVSFLSSVLLFTFGMMYFRKIERRFADIA